mmetsp:Transcript_5339/g.12408  ORF Transcript_5339/g.12408 Transcript_5339/m.12408 type:complete len:261 (+) Transcript_5339:810-1592(+)
MMAPYTSTLVTHDILSLRGAHSIASRNLSTSPFTRATVMRFVPTLRDLPTHVLTRLHRFFHAVTTGGVHRGPASSSSPLRIALPKGLTYSPLTPYLTCLIVRLCSASKNFSGTSVNTTRSSTACIHMYAWSFLGLWKRCTTCGACLPSSVKKASPTSSLVLTFLICSQFALHISESLASMLLSDLDRDSVTVCHIHDHAPPISAVQSLFLQLEQGVSRRLCTADCIAMPKSGRCPVLRPNPDHLFAMTISSSFSTSGSHR